jgi:hypothetical protein
LLEGVVQVVQIIYCEVFDAKIIDNQYELSWLVVVLPKSRYKRALEIALFV